MIMFLRATIIWHSRTIIFSFVNRAYVSNWVVQQVLLSHPVDRVQLCFLLYIIYTKRVIYKMFLLIQFHYPFDVFCTIIDFAGIYFACEVFHKLVVVFGYVGKEFY